VGSSLRPGGKAALNGLHGSTRRYQVQRRHVSWEVFGDNFLGHWWNYVD